MHRVTVQRLSCEGAESLVLLSAFHLYACLLPAKKVTDLHSQKWAPTLLDVTWHRTCASGRNNSFGAVTVRLRSDFIG